MGWGWQKSCNRKIIWLRTLHEWRLGEWRRGLRCHVEKRNSLERFLASLECSLGTPQPHMGRLYARSEDTWKLDCPATQVVLDLTRSLYAGGVASMHCLLALSERNP